MIHLCRILEIEVHNANKIYLYKEPCGLWRAYEHSAYILSKAFPKLPVELEVFFAKCVLCTATVEINEMKKFMVGIVMDFHDGYLEIVTGSDYSTDEFQCWKKALYQY